MRISYICRAVLSVLALIVAWSGSPAHAMSVSPTHIELLSAGNASRAQVTVRNDGNTPLPVEAVLERLDMDENGKHRKVRDEESFLVFPPQTLIPPGGTQVFRITWVGEPLLESSQSFVLTLAQLPVKLKQSKSRVQVVMAFGVVINVAPPRGDATLKIVNSSTTTNKNGERNPVLTVQNPTKVHALLPKATIKLTGRNWSQTLSPAELDQKVGIGLVQPGKRRRFVLPVPLPTGVTEVKASLEYPRVRK